MPCSMNKAKKQKKKELTKGEIDNEEDSTQLNSEQMQNKNLNHISTSRSGKQISLRDREIDRKPERVSSRSRTVKSKVVEVNRPVETKTRNDAANVNTEAVKFIENGEIIQMEINDGGAAAAEYASEEEVEHEQDEALDHTKTESESDSDEENLESDNKSGEVNLTNSES